MLRKKTSYIGVDLFAGAGGMSLGAQMAGVSVQYAIEQDAFAAKTYNYNHPTTILIEDDIRNVPVFKIDNSRQEIILFGGPPCQGFSTSNQKTRSRENPSNWLYQEFIRFAKGIMPEWIVFENVRGIAETEKGFFVNTILNQLENLGYTCSSGLLCASDFGVPQHRHRFFIIGSLSRRTINIPVKGTAPIVTVQDAISDLPELDNGSTVDELRYSALAKTEYADSLRGTMESCTGHLVTRNSEIVISRYKYIPQGGNWKHIPEELMTNYKDKSRCHAGIYRRLEASEPSVTIGNFRKAMLIHPWQDRGLSVREAARLQSFPDNYRFMGSIGFQQQQVGNAVPPLLAKSVFSIITEREDRE